MSNSNTIVEEEPSVSLSLQSLIDARFGVPHPSSVDIKGLSSLSGQIRGRKRGQGLEFEDLREYASGDDVRHIDWKVSARHNQLFTRLYREEKEQRVTLVIDFRSPMFTGSNELRAVQAGKLAANLAWFEVNAGGRCGLMVQTDHEFITLPPALGDHAALAICAEISRQFNRAKEYAASTDRPVAATNDTDHKPDNDILERLRSTGRDFGALIVLTGLDKINDKFKRHLQEIAVEKQMAVVQIEDAMEYTALPEGTFRYKTGGKSIRIVLNRKQTQSLRTHLLDQYQQLDTLFRDAHVPLLRSRNGINDTRSALHQLGFLA